MKALKMRACAGLAAVLWVLCPLAGFAVEAPIITAIDPYVVKADVRSYLTDVSMAGYRKLIDGVFAREKRVELSKDFDANLQSLGALQGSPYFFFVDKFEFTNKNTAMKLTYKYPAEEQSRMRAFIDGEYLALLNEIIRPGMNELEKVLAVYRYFGLRIQYNYDWLEAFRVSDDKFQYPGIEMYEALSTNRGVCHSYTYLCEFALQQLGIECLRFTGEMRDIDEGHMWLVVRIDGEYHHCDLTWDSHGGFVGLEYFGMTDRERRDSGVVNFEICYDLSYGEVKCDSEAFRDFRGVVGFDFAEGVPHRLILHYGGEDGEYDTLDRRVCEMEEG